jgi:RNA polymerase sigma factor (sigma-70 family)
VSGTPTDGEILADHLGGSGSAFEVLASRHAAMVLASCRRVLGQGPDAEDAAQAAFMVLLRRARSLTGQRDLGRWLHRTAVLVSRNALRARARRARREKEAAVVKPAGTAPQRGEGVWQGLAPHLDSALESLPAAQRQVLVLCYFEGLSQSQAAERLALPEGTVATRCARGLEKLRRQLSSRGAAVGTAALGALLLERAARAAAALPEIFLPSVVSAAKGAAASAPILALTEGALKMMFWTKVKLTLATAGAVVVAAVATPWALSAASGEDPSARAADPDRVRPAGDDEAKPNEIELIGKFVADNNVRNYFAGDLLVSPEVSYKVLGNAKGKDLTAKADGKRVKVIGTVKQVNTEDGGMIRILTVKSFEIVKPARDPGATRERERGEKGPDERRPRNADE